MICEWVFDSLGRVLEERQNGRAVSSRYAGDGKRTQVVYPGGCTITRGFDGLDRIKTLADQGGQLAASDWIGPGLRELRRVNGNGTRLTFLNDAGSADVGYDAVQRIVRLRCLLPDNATAFVDREYAYNRASQRTLERRHDDFGLTDSYTYDSAYRVVACAYDQAGGAGATPRDLSAVTYRYDGVGNRRDVAKESASAGTVAESYSVNAMNEYAAIGPSGAQVARTHDDNGNLTHDGARVLVWDAFNRLVGVVRKSDGAPIAAYFYLPDGRRSRKVVYSQATPGVVEREVRFVWDGAREVEEQSATGATLATFVWSPVYVDEVVEFRREAAHPLGAGSFYAHQDARCDVVAVTNASGAVVEKRRYDDFGNMEVRDAAGQLLAQSPVGLEYGFQGRRHDPETGWLYFRARFYDPEAGRFLSRDPVWDASNVGGWYTFVGNGPVSGRDPFGEQYGGWGGGGLDYDKLTPEQRKALKGYGEAMQAEQQRQQGSRPFVPTPTGMSSPSQDPTRAQTSSIPTPTGVSTPGPYGRELTDEEKQNAGKVGEFLATAYFGGKILQWGGRAVGWVWRWVRGAPGAGGAGVGGAEAGAAGAGAAGAGAAAGEGAGPMVRLVHAGTLRGGKVGGMGRFSTALEGEGLAATAKYGAEGVGRTAFNVPKSVLMEWERKGMLRILRTRMAKKDCPEEFIEMIEYEFSGEAQALLNKFIVP